MFTKGNILGVSVLNGQCFFNLGGPGGSFGGPGGGFGGPGGGFFSTGSSSGLPLLLPVLKPPPGAPKPPPGPPKQTKTKQKTKQNNKKHCLAWTLGHKGVHFTGGGGKRGL